MTVSEDVVVLWDDGKHKLKALSVPSSAQYVYPYGTCITIGFSYENKLFKGYDHFAFFGKEYDKLIKLLESIDKTLDGQICLYDVGGDTDGYIDITCKNGKLRISGRLGATWSQFCLYFEFNADQTFLKRLFSVLG